jgi:large subunit ribosomal protein L17
MRHRKAGRHLGRSSGHPKQRDVKKLSAWFNAKRADQLIGLADDGDEEALTRMAEQMALHARRQVLSQLSDRDIALKLVEEIAPRFEDRPGGYTRMFKLGMRHGDAAKMALLELVE